MPTDEPTIPVSRRFIEQAMTMASWHIGDRDECGTIANEVYEYVKLAHKDIFDQVREGF